MITNNAYSHIKKIADKRINPRMHFTNAYMYCLGNVSNALTANLVII